MNDVQKQRVLDLNERIRTVRTQQAPNWREEEKVLIDLRDSILNRA